MTNENSDLLSVEFEQFFLAISSWPLQTKIGLSLCFLTWLVGGNIVFYLSLKRRGESYWKALIPTRKGMKAMYSLSGYEWAALACLAVFSLACASWGMSAQNG